MIALSCMLVLLVVELTTTEFCKGKLVSLSKARPLSDCLDSLLNPLFI